MSLFPSCVALQRVGVVLAHTLEGVERLGFTPSDIAAGLALIRVSQKEREALIVQSAVRTHLTSQVSVDSLFGYC
jgi:hypothetical protein